MHPYITAELARLRIAELHAAAAEQRLAREARAARKAAGELPGQRLARRLAAAWRWLDRTGAGRRPAADWPERVELTWPDGVRSVIELPPLAPPGPAPSSGEPRSAWPGAGPARRG